MVRAWNCIGTVITTGAAPGTVVVAWSRLKWTPSLPVEAKVVLLAGVAQVMADRDAAIARELNRLIQSG